MMGPFYHPPFTPRCHINALLTHLQKNSTSRSVILDLSWALPPSASLKKGMLRDTYLSVPQKITLPLAQDLASLI